MNMTLKNNMKTDNTHSGGHEYLIRSGKQKITHNELKNNP